MSAFQNWLNQLNFEKLLELLITIAAAWFVSPCMR